MPAIAEEIAQALDEGVELRLQCAAVAVRGSGRARALELCAIEMGPPDASGRCRPVPTSRVTELECDHVLLALGQAVDDALVPSGFELDRGRPSFGNAGCPVLLAGDFATSQGTVAHAVGDGRRAAGRLLRALGEDVAPFERPAVELAVRPDDVHLDRFVRMRPAEIEVAPVAGRVRGFGEVTSGLLTPDEAERCLGCGRCTECDRCLVYCPDGIIRRDATARYRIDYDFCKGCGVCVTECPRAGMTMVAEGTTHLG
jgi:2-oxoacid:acceptor oxidoreductase delta subunit (pyruvate/2-ketoisovalerate family)